MAEYVETVIVGGGQAGLAASYHLTQQGRAHAILEQAPQAAGVWRDHRWDWFALVTPNCMTRVPGAEYQGDDLHLRQMARANAARRRAARRAAKRAFHHWSRAIKQWNPLAMPFARGTRWSRSPQQVVL